MTNVYKTIQEQMYFNIRIGYEKEREYMEYTKLPSPHVPDELDNICAEMSASLNRRQWRTLTTVL